jgi:hypothetical protein
MPKLILGDTWKGQKGRRAFRSCHSLMPMMERRQEEELGWENLLR